MDPRIAEIERNQLRSDLPAFEAGDTLRVLVRVVEGAKERVQAFEGICIARRGSGINETFMVRKVSGGVGVERIFPVHSPTIAGIEVVRRGHVRRAKLYYLRERRGKRARVRERRWWESSGLAPGPVAEAAEAPETAEAAEAGAEDVVEEGDVNALDVQDVDVEDVDAEAEAEPTEA